MTGIETTAPLRRAGLAARASAQSRAALLVLLLAPFVVVLDFFIVNVAIPAIQGDLGASSGAVEWIVAGYGLTFATVLVTAGRLGDRFGRRRLLQLGLALFTVASAGCGLAPTPAALVAARVAQGLAAALLTPQTLAIIGIAYEGERRARALGAYAMTLGLAAVSGQLVGGLLIEADVAGLGWRTIFLINVPIGVAALALLPRLVPESRAAAAPGIDFGGTTLLTLALVAVVLPLIEGRAHGWPLWTWLCLGAVPLLLAHFAVQQRRLGRRGGEPLLDAGLLRQRAFAVGLAAQLAFFSGMASFFLVLALYLQQGRGLGALEAGLVFTILAAGYCAASAQAPPLAAKLGRRLPVLGAVTLAAGHALVLAAVSWGGQDGSLGLLAPGLLVAGAGMGLVLTPLTTTVVASLPERQAGAASGALSTAQQVGNALGVAVIGVIFFGALDAGYGHAFAICLGVLVGLSAGVALLARLLPREAGAA